MKTIALLLIAVNAHAHGGPDAGIHHALPLLPSLIVFITFYFNKLRGA